MRLDLISAFRRAGMEIAIAKTMPNRRGKNHAKKVGMVFASELAVVYPVHKFIVGGLVISFLIVCCIFIARI